MVVSRTYSDIGRHGVQIGLDLVVLQPLHDLGQEQLHPLQGHAETDLDEQEAVGRGPLKNLQRLPQVELLVHHRRTVDQDAVVSQSLFVGVQEGCFGGALGQVPEREQGEQNRGGTLDDEQPPPGVVDQMGVDLEDAKCQETAECTGDIGSSVEYGQSSGEFASAVEGGQVVDDEGEEGALRHAYVHTH